MKRRNLEKAVVLSLVLSTGVYGTAWAEDIQSGGLWTDANKKIEAGDNLIVTTNSVGIGFNGTVNVIDGDLTVNAGGNGIESGYTETAQVKILANNITIKSSQNGIFTSKGEGGIFSTNRGYVVIGEKDGRRIDSLTIVADGQGIDNKKGKTEIYGSENSVIDIHSTGNGGINPNQAAINNEGSGDNGVVMLEGGLIKLTADTGNGITNSSGTTSLTSKRVVINANVDGIHNSSGQVILDTAGQNFVTAKSNGINSTSSGTITISAATGNIISAEETGILAKKGTVDVKSGINNTLKSGDGIKDTENENIIYGNNLAIKAGNESKLGNWDLSTSGVVNLTADNGYNYISGAVYASVKGTNVSINSFNNSNASGNYVYSAATIEDAGGIDTESNTDDNKFYGKKFVSALYAENGANIELNGENVIGTYADNTDENTLERSVWAYSNDDKVASSINITGASMIGTNRYSTSPNSADIAIAAGTDTPPATDLTKDKVDKFNGERSTVNVEYDDFSTGASSSITGDILSAYAGQVNIKAKEGSNAGIYITGNLLSGNNGILNVDLGNGGRLEGRIDDYQDAGTDNKAEEGHLKFYDPAFSSTIYSSGNITLDMGKGSYWKVTGQSWVTSLTGEGSIIDMRKTLNDDNNSYAVHIGTLTGNNTFVMDLNDNDHNISDMLYIKDEENSSGEHTVFLNSVEGLENMADGDKLRFATVNAGTDKLTFVGKYEGENGYQKSKSRVMLYDAGFNNAAFEIKNETYSTADTENEGYNGKDFDDTKPGNEYVDEAYGDGATNWYLTRNSSGDEMSDAGKTILNMSRANYSNAIYMDRLNKRLGEARYINGEEEDGMWVRIRHDRIGKTDAYRSQNTMYELGYDKKQECDNGERRVGFAIDYMHGDTGYNGIAGKGEIDRYGLWLYDTWLGDKGHYADYVAKWGHLDNDFEIYAPTTGEKIDGDYSNNVFSISAEYGRKKDIGSDWYFEPQIQAQLARVTGADYTTSQGTKVSVDGINSLIGRAGFRLGKDFGEEKQSTVYVKADVLHEFLGDQDIKALDATTNGNWSKISYDNEGTWYDVGLGFAAQMSKNSYAFLDLERSFGHDNDETYQINVGMQWSF